MRNRTIAFYFPHLHAILFVVDLPSTFPIYTGPIVWCSRGREPAVRAYYCSFTCSLLLFSPASVFLKDRFPTCFVPLLSVFGSQPLFGLLLTFYNDEHRVINELEAIVVALRTFPFF